MNFALMQLISMVLPVTVLVLVPCLLEPHLSVRTDSWFWPGAALTATGLILLTQTIFLFITIGRGTLAPWFPPGKLVVSGPYRYVRNPMILGVLTVLLGESVVCRSLLILAWMALFFGINHLFFVLYEEPNLAKRFGEAYLAYRQDVPRWLPDFRKILRLVKP